MATVGLDTSAYQQGIEEAKAQTKESVATMAKDYSRLYSEVLHLQAAYKKSVEETGKNSQATKDLKAKLSEAQAQLNSTSSALETAEKYMNSFGDAASKAAKESKSAGDAQKSLVSELTASITKGMTLSNLILSAGKAAFDGAKQFVSMGIEYNAQIESYRVGLTNMLGDAEAANAAMQAIQEDAARTPFSVDSLTQANQLLISAGENAEYSRKVINALGDAVSATGGSNAELSRMAANLQQIANVGKASAIDIKQFAYAGINVYQVLADYTGKTVQEVQSMTVSYDLLSQALIAASEEGGRYYNAMNDLSETANGKTSTLKDNVKQLAGLLTEDLSKSIVTVEGNLNDMTVAAIEAYNQDGWTGLIGKITGLADVADRAKSSFVGLKAVIDALKSGEIGILHGDWDSVYWNAFNSDQKTKQGKKDWEKDHAGMIWDENDGWVPAKTSDSGKSSITTSPTGTTKTKTPSQKHVAADTKKLADSIKDTTTEIVKGTENMVGNIKRVTETADNTYNVYDGTTKKIKGTTKETVKTITDSWVEVVDGTEKTIKKVTKETTDAAGKVTTTVDQTCDNVVLSVSELQSRIDKNLSEAQQKWSGGIFGRLQSMLTDVKNGNWSGLATDIAKLIWGEVSQEQREIISKWATDALTAINNSYSGGGAKAAYESIKALFTNGIAADATEAKTAVQSFGEILDGLGASGGVGAKLAGIATSFSSMSGGVISSLGSIVSFITANPILAAILGLTVLAGGIGLAALSKKSKGSDSVTVGNPDSPFSKTPIYDSLAEFSARADSLSRYSTATVSPFSGRQDSTGKQQLSVLQRISNSLDEHLPAIGTGQVVFDTGAVAGALRPALVDGIDTDLGTRAKRKARGG